MHVSFIYSSSEGYLYLFHALAIVNNSEMIMGMQMSPWHTDFNSLDMYPEMGLLDHMAVLFLVFSIPILFSIQPIHDTWLISKE